MRRFFIITLIVVLIAVALRNTPGFQAAAVYVTGIWRKALGALTTGKAQD